MQLNPGQQLSASLTHVTQRVVQLARGSSESQPKTSLFETAQLALSFSRSTPVDPHSSSSNIEISQRPVSARLLSQLHQMSASSALVPSKGPDIFSTIIGFDVVTRNYTRIIENFVNVKQVIESFLVISEIRSPETLNFFFRDATGLHLRIVDVFFSGVPGVTKLVSSQLMSSSAQALN
jgi:hypothetical protein